MNTPIAELNRLQVTIRDNLTSVRTVPYIVYHDAYQHFAKAFDLARPIPIALSDARAPGAAKLKQIRSLGTRTKCVFAEVQHDDAIVKTVSDGLSLKRGILDPIGSELPAGPSLYAEMLNNLAASFLDCLSD